LLHLTTQRRLFPAVEVNQAFVPQRGRRVAPETR
jgi:hypothetical protein